MAELIDEIKCQRCYFAVYGHEQMSCCMPQWIPEKMIDFYLKNINEDCPCIGKEHNKRMQKVRNK